LKQKQKKTTHEWLEILEGPRIPYAAINDVKDTLEHGQSQPRRMVTEVEHEGLRADEVG
jgi:succinate---hydroxymethylglutarate CoA-transferase